MQDAYRLSEVISPSANLQIVTLQITVFVFPPTLNSVLTEHGPTAGPEYAEGRCVT